jgi:hypothetical protein
MNRERGCDSNYDFHSRRGVGEFLEEASRKGL